LATLVRAESIGGHLGEDGGLEGLFIFCKNDIKNSGRLRGHGLNPKMGIQLRLRTFFHRVSLENIFRVGPRHEAESVEGPGNFLEEEAGEPGILEALPGPPADLASVGFEFEEIVEGDIAIVSYVVEYDRDSGIREGFRS
jgi:hypothetical protein